MKKPPDPGKMPSQWKSIRSFASSYSADPSGFQKNLSRSTLWASLCHSYTQSPCASAVVAACTEWLTSPWRNSSLYHEVERKRQTRNLSARMIEQALTATQASFSAMRLPYSVWRFAFIAASSAAVGFCGTGPASACEIQAMIKTVAERKCILQVQTCYCDWWLDIGVSGYFRNFVEKNLLYINFRS